MLYEIAERLAKLDKPVLFTHSESLPLLRRYFKIKLGKRFADEYRAFEDNDLALEWCENRVLARSLPERAQRTAAPKDYELFAGFSRTQLAEISKRLKRLAFRADETIIRTGDQANEMFFLARGGVSVFTSDGGEGRRRLATFSAGMVFGEMAAVDRAPRSAMIVADTEVECDSLALDDLDELSRSHPDLKIKLLENLNLCLCRRLRTVNRKLSVFG
jgi:glutaminase